MPIIVYGELGGTPRPPDIPPAHVLDDVTYGYVPKSRSKCTALAPSTNKF